jgi:hypothetical protein
LYGGAGRQAGEEQKPKLDAQSNKKEQEAAGRKDGKNL